MYAYTHMLWNVFRATWLNLAHVKSVRSNWIYKFLESIRWLILLILYE
jgi:hypothetical protein